MKHRSTHRAITKRLALIAASATLLIAGASFAAAPTTSLIEGVMTSSGGGAAADGTYDVTFSLWATKTGGTATWSEGPVKVAVKGGQFSYALGTAKALDITKIAALKAQWLGLKIGTDPMLARQLVHASLFARWAGTAGGLTCSGCITQNHIANGSIGAAKMGFNYAGSTTKGGPASNLACTGCVSMSELKFDGNANFGAFTVTAKTFVGDGSKLTGIKTPSGTCSKKGEVVKGINADGTLKCVAALDPAALPADGLNEISNNMLTNQFVVSVSAPTKKVLIPDNQGTEAVSNITFPDIGTAQTLKIAIAVANTDLSTVSMTLLPPDDKKTGWLLCDPCGKKDVKKYSKTFSPAVPPQAQKGTGKKIAGFIGGNVKGLWTLKVKDTSFCVPQAPGNSVYCNPTTKKDGWITDWSISMQYVSNKKVAVNGDQEVLGNMTVKGTFKFGNNTVKCDAASAGSMRYNAAAKYMEYCNGTKWTGTHKPATFRWATFDTYANGYMGWLIGNDANMFGGVNPSNWTDGNYRAVHMSSTTETLLTIFNKKGYAGANAMVAASVYFMYSSTSGRVTMALFRVHNATSKAITWTPYWRYTAYTGWAETAGVALNGKEIWAGNCGTSTCSRSSAMSIPANRTSTVIFTSTSAQPWSYGYSIQIRANVLAFYNNSLKLPSGLQFVDDLETKSNGWTN